MRPPAGSPEGVDPPISMPLLAPGSHDETFLGTPYARDVRPTEPDPILGVFSSDSVASAAGAELSTRSIPARRSGSSANFPSLRLDLATTAAVSEAFSLSPSHTEPAPSDDDEPDEPRRQWLSVFLASYASAATLALVWFVWTARGREKPEPPIVLPRVENPAGPITRDLSRTVEPPEPILGEHFATMGQPLRVGSLEITPLEVKRQDVRLQRSGLLSTNEQRDGGKRALFLRLKVRNTSQDTIFAPLDPAYLRDRGDKLVDTYVTTADSERIYPFPLAVESEWSIVGQDFRELKPGESRIVAIATTPEAPATNAGSLTWRVRLRTGLDRTDVIGLVWPAAQEPPK